MSTGVLFANIVKNVEHLEMHAKQSIICIGLYFYMIIDHYFSIKNKKLQ